MSNRYRAKTKAGESIWQAGEFEHEFASADEERDALNGGHIELVPRDYLVVSANFSDAGVPLWQGAILTASIPMEIEAMWVSQGHLQRVEDADIPSKDELMEEAKRLDIKGRSSMTKEELAEAIAEASVPQTQVDQSSASTPKE